MTSYRGKNVSDGTRRGVVFYLILLVNLIALPAYILDIHNIINVHRQLIYDVI
jgi:hypothetical protein